MFEAILRSFVVSSSSVSENVISKSCKISNAVAAVFLLWELAQLFRRFMEEVRKQVAVTYIGFAMRIVDVTVWLVISTRRIRTGSAQSQALNKLSATSVRCKYWDVGVVMVTGTFVAVLELGLVSGDSYIYTCSLIVLIRLGFECSVIIVLVTQESLYKRLNESVRQSINQSTNLLAFRSKYEGLHSNRVAMNESYGYDLFLYFASSQLNMLLECLDLAKSLVKDKELDAMGAILAGLRFAKVFAVMTYLIWRWHKVSNEVGAIYGSRK